LNNSYNKIGSNNQISNENPESEKINLKEEIENNRNMNLKTLKNEINIVQEREIEKDFLKNISNISQAETKSTLNSVVQKSS